MEKKKVVVTIEARMTSSRLPGKVLMESCGKPMLELMIERIRKSKEIDEVVVATTINSQDDPIVDLCNRIKCPYYRGSEKDVLDRVLKAARSAHADIIVETTGDCPFIDWRHIDYLVSLYTHNDYDFAANNTEKSFPKGFDIRIFTTDMLSELNKSSTNPLDHEHVSIYFPEHPEKFKCFNWIAQGKENRPELEVTLDEIGDYRLINSIFEGLYNDNKDFSCLDVIDYIDFNPDILDFVNGIKRTSFDYNG